MLYANSMGEYSIYVFGGNTLRLLKHLKLFTLKHCGCSACFKMNEARDRCLAKLTRLLSSISLYVTASSLKNCSYCKMVDMSTVYKLKRLNKNVEVSGTIRIKLSPWLQAKLVECFCTFIITRPVSMLLAAARNFFPLLLHVTKTHWNITNGNQIYLIRVLVCDRGLGGVVRVEGERFGRVETRGRV